MQNVRFDDHSFGIRPEAGDYLLRRLGRDPDLLAAFDTLIDDGFEGSFGELCDLARAATGREMQAGASEKEQRGGGIELPRLPARLGKAEWSASLDWHVKHLWNASSKRHPFFLRSGYLACCRSGDHNLTLQLAEAGDADSEVWERLCAHRDATLRAALVLGAPVAADAAAMFPDDTRVRVASARALRAEHARGQRELAALVQAVQASQEVMRLHASNPPLVLGGVIEAYRGGVVSVRTLSGERFQVEISRITSLVGLGSRHSAVPLRGRPQRLRRRALHQLEDWLHAAFVSGQVDEEDRSALSQALAVVARLQVYGDLRES